MKNKLKIMAILVLSVAFLGKAAFAANDGNTTLGLTPKAEIIGANGGQWNFSLSGMISSNVKAGDVISFDMKNVGWYRIGDKEIMYKGEKIAQLKVRNGRYYETVIQERNGVPDDSILPGVNDWIMDVVFDKNIEKYAGGEVSFEVSTSSHIAPVPTNRDFVMTSKISHNGNVLASKDFSFKATAPTPWKESRPNPTLASFYDLGGGSSFTIALNNAAANPFRKGDIVTIKIDEGSSMKFVEFAGVAKTGAGAYTGNAYPTASDPVNSSGVFFVPKRESTYNLLSVSPQEIRIEITKDFAAADARYYLRKLAEIESLDWSKVDTSKMELTDTKITMELNGVKKSVQTSIKVVGSKENVELKVKEQNENKTPVAKSEKKEPKAEVKNEKIEAPNTGTLMESVTIFAVAFAGALGAIFYLHKKGKIHLR